MKKICLSLLVIMFFGLPSLFSQEINNNPDQSPIVPYRLFQTTNRWTFLELDTMTGKIWQIQYDVGGNNRGGVVLNDKDLAEDKEKIPGRFTLYPTQNMWTFILLDQIDGSSWQVQWAMEKENRFVISIY